MPRFARRARPGMTEVDSSLVIPGSRKSASRNDEMLLMVATSRYDSDFEIA
jgi:hypothetical protein